MVEPSIPRLSKSRFLAGLQCHKRLYLECFARDEATPPSTADQARFDAGTEVGVLARRLVPGGVLVTEDHFHHEAAVRRTRTLLQRADVPAIFEAAFTEDDIRIRVDILVRAGRDTWDIIEVKSTSDVKAHHRADVAVQLITVEAAGLSVQRVSLAHLNRDYVYPGGAHQAKDLFTIADITSLARERATRVADDLRAMRAPLHKTAAPTIDTGRHCRVPYGCQFYEYCTADAPGWPIEDLPWIRSERVDELKQGGVRSILDLPSNAGLSALQERVRQATITAKPYVSPDLDKALNRLTPPVHFIDFETIMQALPLYVGTRPYQRVPFQWSDHVLQPDGALDHADFLAAGDTDPRREFVETLAAQLRGAATTVVYSGYEESTLRQLAESFPDLSLTIDAILAVSRVDLLPIVRDHYYDREFGGSFSLKSVLPVLVPTLSYRTLGVSDGNEASLAFLESVHPGTTDRRRAEIRRELLTYCGLDTEAMVRIVGALKAVA